MPRFPGGAMPRQLALATTGLRPSTIQDVLSVLSPKISATIEEEACSVLLDRAFRVNQETARHAGAARDSEDRKIAAKGVWFHGHENGSDYAVP